MNIDAMVWDALAKAMEAEGRRIAEKARQMMEPYVVDALRYAAFTEYGKGPDDLDGVTVDSTAIVLDDSMKALPEPKKGR